MTSDTKAIIIPVLLGQLLAIISIMAGPIQPWFIPYEVITETETIINM